MSPNAGSSPAPIGIGHSAIETYVHRPRRWWPGLAKLRIRARPTTGDWVRFAKMANRIIHILSMYIITNAGTVRVAMP